MESVTWKKRIKVSNRNVFKFDIQQNILANYLYIPIRVRAPTAPECFYFCKNLPVVRWDWTHPVLQLDVVVSILMDNFRSSSSGRSRMWMFCRLCQPLLTLPELFMIRYKTPRQSACCISHSSHPWALVCELDLSQNPPDLQKAERFSSSIQKVWGVGSGLFFRRGMGFSSSFNGVSPLNLSWWGTTTCFCRPRGENGPLWGHTVALVVT